MKTYQIALTGLALAALAPLSTAANNGPFQDQGGVLAVEVESQTPIPSWVEYQQFSGYTGAGYFRWDGPNYFNSPGNGVMRYDFEVNTSGTWQLSLRNRHNNSQPDQENDLWVRMDGGSWKKVYSNLGSSTVNKWNWHTRFDNGSQAHTDALYTLSAGQHSIYFSGRSNGFMIDRFHMHVPNHPDMNNDNLPQSPCGNGGPQSYCQAKLSPSGCVATMTTSAPSAQPVSGANNYDVIVSGAEGQRLGVFFTTTTGKNSFPFMGGTLCMQAPFKRSPVLFTGGNDGACDGRFSLRVNDGEFVTNGDGFDAGPGGTSYVQAWHREPNLNDGFDIILSDAIQLDWQ